MTNIVYPTQCAVFFLNETSSIKEAVLLSLPSNLGLVFGEILLMLFGTPLGHWCVLFSQPLFSLFTIQVLDVNTNPRVPGNGHSLAP